MDIVHDFWINAARDEVFAAISSGEGLSTWWTARAKADQRLGGVYELWFGPGYDWRAEVTDYEQNVSIAWTLTEAAEDWTGTTVSFRLEDAVSGTSVHFEHLGWAEDGSHYRISCYCWAMYLRLLKRYVQHGEVVDYADRLEA